MSAGDADSPVRVVKFGGAALDAPGPAIDLVRRRRDEGHRVVVVTSARSSVTDLLIAAARGGTDAVDAGWKRLGELHPGLDPSEVLRPDPADAQAFVASGERFGARWFANELRRVGLVAASWDADEMGLATDGTPWAGRIDLTGSRTPVRGGVVPVLAAGHVAVVTGFLARSPSGDVNLLGRGGSDYTATAIANLLDATEVELVKAGGPVRSADPLFVPRARPIPHLHYDDAAALARAGARILHPAAVGPARDAGIPITIRGLSDEAGLTRIDGARSPPALRAVVVSSVPPRSVRLTIWHPELGTGLDPDALVPGEAVIWDQGGPGWSSALVPAPSSRRLALLFHRAVAEPGSVDGDARTPRGWAPGSDRGVVHGLLQGAGS